MINWDRVEDLRTDVGADDFDEIVEVFLIEVDGIANALQTAKVDQDIELHLHALKNAALNLGFYELAALCQTSEKLAASKQARLVNFREVLGCLDASLKLFRDGLPERFRR